MSTTMKTSTSSSESLYKKSTALPEETPHNLKLINGNTPGSKNQWLAEFLISNIGDRDHPMKRPISSSLDREFRGLISERNAAGEDLIINNGSGYYRPGADDRPAMLEYWMKEKHRAREIEKKADTMMNTFISMYGGYD